MVKINVFFLRSYSKMKIIYLHFLTNKNDVSCNAKGLPGCSP